MENGDAANSLNHVTAKENGFDAAAFQADAVPHAAVHGIVGSDNRPVAAVEEAYHTLTVDDVLPYVERTLSQWAPATAGAAGFQPGEFVSAAEIGDGNLNLVFRLLDRHGISRAVLKQSLPYVRCVGESWPLTLDRNRLEAETLRAHYAHAPETAERVLFHSSAMAVTVVEDLSDMVIWRSELVKGRHHAHAAPTLAEHLARIHYFTSDFAQGPIEKKHAVQRVTNTDMCLITEDLFFSDPFVEHERNRYEPEQEALVQHLLREDALLKVKVAQLKHVFMNKPEAHIHGDIHTGSVFLDDTRVKAIDAEFGFYGPMGFDVGTALGNLLLNYVALPALLEQRNEGPEKEKEEKEEEEGRGREKPHAPPVGRAPTSLTAATVASTPVLLESVRQLWVRYAEVFLALASTPGNTRDTAFAFPGYASVFLQENVWPDTVGFAGTEMIRRTVGLAHVADLDGIESKERRLAAKAQSLRLGAALVKSAKHLHTIEDLVDLVKQGSWSL